MEVGTLDRVEESYAPGTALVSLRGGELREQPAESVKPGAVGQEFYALQAMEPLFVAGDERDRVYRVEAGMIVVSYPATATSSEDYDLIYPGSYVGIGFLSHYTASAFAAEATTVSCLTPEQYERRVAANPALGPERAAAVAREYAARRAECIRSGQGATPLQRVARLLVALSNLAVREGCGLRNISDTLDSRFVAQLLDMPIDDLEERVRQLARLGLVRLDASSGILLHDIAGLEAAC